MCCNNMWFYIDMSHCEWAVCGYEDFFGVGVGWYSSVCNQIKVHTRGCREVVKSGLSCSYSTYQHEAITSRSRQLLMMGTWLPETC